jgi:hypothetical protein
MNKWRLVLGWGLGSLTLLNALNALYALLSLTQGVGVYQPMLVGRIIGQINATTYFLVTTGMTIGFLGLTMLFAFPPSSVVAHLGNTIPTLNCLLPDAPDIEALQTVQINVLDQIQSSEEMTAERLDNLTTHFQTYHQEILAFLERQEDTTRILLATIPQKTDAHFNELKQLITERRENDVVKNKPTVIRSKMPKRSVSRNQVRTKKSSGIKVTWRRGL